MFAVKYVGTDQPKFKTIYSGIAFGDGEKELIFEINTAELTNPLRVSFFKKTDKTKTDFLFEVGKIIDNSLTVTFYNASEVGISGLVGPAGIILVGELALSIMFKIDSFANTGFYQLTYEFYEGDLQKHGVIL